MFPMASNDFKVLPSDAAVLREMAKRVRDLAQGPANLERIRLWYKHDECRGERPLILTETDGGLQIVVGDYKPRCREAWAVAQEWELLRHITHAETIGDDWPIDPAVDCPWEITRSNFGVETHETAPQTDGTRGAVHIDAVLQDLERDFHKLRPRTYAVDREKTRAKVAAMEEVFGGILPVRMRTVPWWSLGLTFMAINLIGLEQLMLYMYDQPAALHRLMAFLRDQNLAMVEWMEREGLLTLNNGNDYIGSGSRGYTHELPQKDHKSGDPVRPRDMWALLESQETVGVGPDLYGEFIYPYEDAIARRFGRVYYGCCEPVHTRWEVVKNLTNLRRVSISAWCNEDIMAETLADRYVYSRKPSPAMISTEKFDEELIRANIRHTLERTKAHGCSAELVMKDVHTLRGEQDRLTRWVRIVRDVIAEIYG
jgi:hypothetical protein